MKKLILSGVLLYSQVYAQTVIPTVNIDIEGQYNNNIVSATGEDLFNYNQRISFFLASELKDDKKNVNIIGMEQNDNRKEKAIQSNQVKPSILISIGFGMMPLEELKYAEYQEKKVSFNDEINGYSLFINTHTQDVKKAVICARNISIVLGKVGFEPNWKYNKNIKLIFEDQPIYQLESNELLNNSKTAVLRIEPGVLSNRKESQWFDQERVSIAFSKAVVIGLKDCLS